MNLPVLDISCKCNHTLLALLCLAYFTQHNVLKSYSCSNIYQNFTTFLAVQYSTVYMSCILFTHSSVDGHLDCFHLLVFVNNVSVSIDIQIFESCFKLFRVYTYKCSC